MNLWLLLLIRLSSSVSEDLVFHFIDEPRSWCDARNFCRKFYTDLATVQDVTDQQRLPPATDAWIGLRNGTRDRDRQWHWSKPGLEFRDSEVRWKSGEPNDKSGIENCAFAQPVGELLLDDGCQTQRRFICFGSSGLKYINTELTWAAAQRYCRDQHMDLVSGPDQLQDLDLRVFRRWVGLFRDTWEWSDGNNSSFRNWELGDPHLNNDYRHDNKNCAKLGGQGQWIRDTCDQSHPFICYDKRYVLVKQMKTWEEAMSHCRQHHLDLAWHHGPHQKRMVQQRAWMADSEVVWVGLHFSCFLEEWLWVNGHYVPADHHNWERPGANDCEVSGAMERGGKWVKRSPEERHNFICVRNR